MIRIVAVRIDVSQLYAKVIAEVGKADASGRKKMEAARPKKTKTKTSSKSQVIELTLSCLSCLSSIKRQHSCNDTHSDTNELF